ncbi:MAG: rRNA pseudouridine synthase [Clostridia bacterium]|nr:rRNA pseudouridine synthase [Clostridia bacterium]
MSETRLQKYMADCGIASRRKCEELILGGMVKINDKVVTELGKKVNDKDVVKYNDEIIKPTAKKIYIALNKPVGYVSTVSDQFGRNTVINLVEDEIFTRLYPIGRLDYDTEGLILLTNDGEITYKLTHPKHNVYKTYIAVLNNVPQPNDIEKLKKGVYIEGKKTNPAKLNWIKDNIVEISISEGRNRQVRKMFAAVGYKVENLKRISIGNILLGNIPLGRWRHLTKAEISYLVNL